MIFDQSVILIFNSQQRPLKHENLLFLSSLTDVPGKLRLIAKNEGFVKDINFGGSFELLKSEEIKNVIAEAGYYVSC